jgi:hypothetical protein
MKHPTEPLLLQNLLCRATRALIETDCLFVYRIGTSCRRPSRGVDETDDISAVFCADVAPHAGVWMKQGFRAAKVVLEVAPNAACGLKQPVYVLNLNISVAPHRACGLKRSTHYLNSIVEVAPTRACGLNEVFSIAVQDVASHAGVD